MHTCGYIALLAMNIYSYILHDNPREQWRSKNHAEIIFVCTVDLKTPRPL